jgi:hypothetical protein
MPKTPIAYHSTPDPPPEKSGLTVRPGDGSLAHFILGNRWVYCRFLGLALVALAAVERLEISYEHGIPEAITTVGLGVAGAVTAWVRQGRESDSSGCEHCSQGSKAPLAEQQSKKNKKRRRK